MCFVTPPQPLHAFRPSDWYSQNADYNGAAVVGTKVYFGPTNGLFGVGVFDDTAQSFSIVQTGTLTAEAFAGAVALGTHVYFTPYNIPQVGVLDATTQVNLGPQTTPPH